MCVCSAEVRNPCLMWKGSTSWYGGGCIYLSLASRSVSYDGEEKSPFRGRRDGRLSVAKVKRKVYPSGGKRGPAPKKERSGIVCVLPWMRKRVCILSIERWR